VTGPVAVALLRDHDRLLDELASILRTRPEGAADVARAREEELHRLERAVREGAAAGTGSVDAEELAARAEKIAGAAILATAVQVTDAKALLEVVDRVKGKLPGAAIVLGTAVDGRVHLVASVAPELVARGVKAGAVVKAAAEVVGGGGGGRDTMAQAGGRHPDRLDEALATARSAIASALA
jgi:alanyl-tRNA synthetase